jgi:CRISPR-associated protein Cas5t
MIGIYISVPIASWRKGGARELWETEALPSPATCYGALLSLVGEENRNTHIGVRVTAGLLNEPYLSGVLRTFWRIKKEGTPQGTGENARPDFQQLWCNSKLMIWCDSTEEAKEVVEPLEQRVLTALTNPEKISRFGGWSLGESTHLINDAKLTHEAALPDSCDSCSAFLLDSNGHHTLPVWVDHVGMSGTKYEVGNLVNINAAPSVKQLPQIMPPK